jgi:hypothetical protein
MGLIELKGGKIMKIGKAVENHRNGELVFSFLQTNNH